MKHVGDLKRVLTLSVFFAGLLPLALLASAANPAPLRQRLKETHFKIAHEAYLNDNWEILVMDADGANPVNLTLTPTIHEHYPQVSPDGKNICFVADEGEGRDAVRSLWVMDTDGRHRRKLTDHAREPFWSPDGKKIGYLPQEYRKFSVDDFYTDGMNFYELATGKISPHPNSAALHHLYNPSFAPNGKWIAATVHGGMGLGHAILLIEANGKRIINLNIPGCRPCLSPDGKSIAWGADDKELAVAPIDLDAQTPSVGQWRMTIKDQKNHIYHIDWSPDCRFLSFSRGPQGRGDPSKPGTFGADYAAIMGVYAPGWNIGVVTADHRGSLDLDMASQTQFLMLTTNGLSNKEPAWFRPSPQEQKSEWGARPRALFHMVRHKPAGSLRRRARGGAPQGAGAAGALLWPGYGGNDLDCGCAAESRLGEKPIKPRAYEKTDVIAWLDRFGGSTAELPHR